MTPINLAFVVEKTNSWSHLTGFIFVENGERALRRVDGICGAERLEVQLPAEIDLCSNVAWFDFAR